VVVSSRRRHTSFSRDWSSDVCSCDLHAQRYEQMAKRADTVAQVFDNPYTAGADDREEAIVQFSIKLTESPDDIGPQDMAALKERSEERRGGEEGRGGGASKEREERAR